MISWTLLQSVISAIYISVQETKKTVAVPRSAGLPMARCSKIRGGGRVSQNHREIYHTQLL
jgi:hypothetical protein